MEALTICSVVSQKKLYLIYHDEMILITAASSVMLYLQVFQDAGEVAYKKESIKG
jgi:hypothetical protein